MTVQTPTPRQRETARRVCIWLGKQATILSSRAEAENDIGDAVVANEIATAIETTINFLDAIELFTNPEGGSQPVQK